MPDEPSRIERGDILATDSGIVATVDGEQRELGDEPGVSLLLALRNRLGLRGVRPGCGVGECGACTVLVDGAPERSCQMPIEAARGRDIATPESLAGHDGDHPLRRAFLAGQAAQCGYCINGMLMTLASLDVDAGADDVREALDEHICRCFAHARIEAAALDGLAGREPVPAWRIVPSRLAGEPTGAAVLPPAIEAEPRVERWVRLSDTGTIEVSTGKVELGQGISTAIAQIAAAQLQVSTDRVEVQPVSTRRAPDEGRTAGSDSIDTGGAAVAVAAAAFRRLVTERAATVLARSSEDLTTGRDGVLAADGTVVLRWEELAAHGPVEGDITSEDLPGWDLTPLGEATPRSDLASKVGGGAAYVHDLQLPGMLHARALLPPSYDARPEGLDAEGLRQREGVVEVVADDRLLVVIADEEHRAIAAVSGAAARTRWDLAPTQLDGWTADAYRQLETERHVALEQGDPGQDEPSHRATYEVPYHAHAPMAPSCAVALHEDGRTTVWSHTQGVYALRKELAALLAVAPEQVEVVYQEGPGCYGQTLADDAAGFAALAAQRVPGTPVRFQFSSEDEFRWEPHGPAGLVDLAATLDTTGCVTAWDHRTLSDAHGTRVRGDGAGLMVGWLGAARRERVWPGAKEAGARNAIPTYAFPAIHAVADAARGPLRTGSLRTLGSFLNVFAAESFMDELAERAGRDPLEFRLAHLQDARAAQVLSLAAETIGWRPHVGPSGRGIGIAFSRYKSVKAYVAQAVEVSVDAETAEIEVTRIVTACDAGAIVNPDGLVNQLEGGTLQALSRTLVERVQLGSNGVADPGWLDYPVLRSGAVPPVETVLVRHDAPPLGAGEASTPPLAPAVANAIDDAIGVRLRTLPLGGDALRRRLYELDERETERVLL